MGVNEYNLFGLRDELHRGKETAARIDSQPDRSNRNSQYPCELWMIFQSAYWSLFRWFVGSHCAFNITLTRSCYWCIRIYIRRVHNGINANRGSTQFKATGTRQLWPEWFRLSYAWAFLIGQPLLTVSSQGCLNINIFVGQIIFYNHHLS